MYLFHKNSNSLSVSKIPLALPFTSASDIYILKFTFTTDENMLNKQTWYFTWFRGEEEGFKVD